MTRRERHLNIIASWGPRNQTYRWELNGLMARHGLKLFTDEAIEEFARALVSAQKRHDKNAAQSRAIYAAQSQGVGMTALCTNCGSEAFAGELLCWPCRTDEPRDYEDSECANCGGEGIVYMCEQEFACIDPEGGCDDCARKCDWCQPPRKIPPVSIGDN